MTGTVSARIFESAQKLNEQARAGIPIQQSFNQMVAEYLQPPFRVGRGMVAAADGVSSGPYESLVCRDVGQITADKQCASEHVACMFHVVDNLTPETINDAYDAIGNVKGLKRNAVPITGPGQTDSTFGVIFALTSKLSLEDIDDEVQRQNSTRPSTLWPDLVVVLSLGTLNYAVQFPGEKIGGDFMLPNFTDFKAVMPFYVHRFIRAIGEHSLNRMFAMLFLQLMVFVPGTKYPDMDTTLEGVSQYGMTLGGYQYNLKGELAPVPRNIYQDRGGLNLAPLRITDRKGRVLSRLAYLPWQDGGVIKIIGPMPIEPFLLFAGPAAMKAQIFKRSDSTLSSVLPISPAEFANMLARFQAQSNMLITPEPLPKLVIDKIADEGTSSPYVARLYAGMLRLRDYVFLDDTARRPFNQAYEPVLTALDNARASAKAIDRLIADHIRRVNEGVAARLENGNIIIEKSIQKNLRRDADAFLISAARAFKDVQKVTKVLGCDIGFLYKKPSNFSTGLAALKNTDSSLAEYLAQTRKRWSEQLVLLRDHVEHGGWVVPPVRYTESAGRAIVGEPAIHGEPLREFVARMLDRVCCFVEEITVHAIQKALPNPTALREIALPRRDPEYPERFVQTLKGSGTKVWTIAYHENRFTAA